MQEGDQWRPPESRSDRPLNFQSHTDLDFLRLCTRKNTHVFTIRACAEKLRGDCRCLEKIRFKTSSKRPKLLSCGQMAETWRKIISLWTDHHYWVITFFRVSSPNIYLPNTKKLDLLRRVKSTTDLQSVQSAGDYSRADILSHNLVLGAPNLSTREVAVCKERLNVERPG